MNKHIVWTLILVIVAILNISASDTTLDTPEYYEDCESHLDERPHGPCVSEAADYNYASLVSNNPAPNLISGLISYWNFDEDLEDGIGTNDGSLEGNGSTYEDGVFGKGIDLDGDDHIEVPHDTTLNFTGKSFTISAWFRVDAFDKFFQTLISKGEGANFRIGRRQFTDSLSFNAGDMGDLVAANIRVNDMEFHHVVAINHAGDSTAIYIDGVLRGKKIANVQTIDTQEPLWIGNNPIQQGRQWNGMIDDVAIWDKPLSASDVAHIYNARIMNMSIGDILCATGDTLYVDANKSTSGDGSCWASALTDLQDAINISNACGGGKQIWIAEGTYRPSQARVLDRVDGAETREKTFYITEPVQIYGGFNNGDTHLSQRDSLGAGTILTGDLGNNQDTAYHVITMEADTIDADWVLDGLVIRDGRATGIASEHKDGGGIYALVDNQDADNSVSATLSFSIINSTFENNTASSQGGGVYVRASASATDDASIALATVSPSIVNSSFNNNTASSQGGAVYAVSQGGVVRFAEVASAATSPSIINSTFNNNTASSQGGAIYFQAFGRNLDNGNGASATVSPSIVNSTFNNNTASNTGGAIYALARDFNSDDNAAINPTISNTIFWRNTSASGPDIWKSDSDPDLSNGSINHSILSSDISVVGMIMFNDTMIRDPLFVDPMNDDLRLRPYSPAINTGDDTKIPAGITTDLDGNQRSIDGTVDRGAYENLEGDCPNHPVLDVSYSPLDGTYMAKSVITIQGVVEILSSGQSYWMLLCSIYLRCQVLQRHL